MKRNADDLVIKAKMYYHNGVLRNNTKLLDLAWDAWCEIYMMYETPEKAPEEKRIKDSRELAAVMSRFTDDEVYGITDYAKKKYIA